ncbi:uncharacterized protein LOC126551227 [Aphis gossypii]|uniref:uncharacterized protein LOC126551227 n=1 Tax=Aphis gossypii TaxID=80765 RepID=UPI0021592C82|nr:uncharacterized protein LOC126551227 [Aphis gossypii]
MHNQISIRYIKNKGVNIHNPKWFKFFQEHNKYSNESDNQIKHYLRNYKLCIKNGKNIITEELKLKELYKILSKKIKQSIYIEKRLEIIFELTNEEKNYWLTGIPFKFHEDIIVLSNKKQSINKYKPVYYEDNFKNRYTQFKIKNEYGAKDLSSFMDDVKKPVLSLIKKWLTIHNALKVNLCVIGSYEKDCTMKSPEIESKYLQTTNYEIFLESNMDEIYINMNDKILYEHERVSDNLAGSNWVLQSIDILNIAINKYDPIRGSTYIRTPDKIANKKSTVNVKNEDNKCFLWSILAHLYPPGNNPQRVYQYEKYKNIFNEVKIEYPMAVYKIPGFVDNVNKKNLIEGGLSINVYHHDEFYKINPLTVTKNEKRVHIDLLLLKNEDNTHYILIKKLWSLIRNQITKDHKKRYLCRMCLNSFQTELKLSNHKNYCQSNKVARITLPYKNKIIKFKNYNHKMKVPFVIYADFESIIAQINYKKEKYSTIKIQKHIAISFVYFIVYVNSDNDWKQCSLEYFGEDSPEIIYKYLKQDAILASKKYLNKIKKIKELNEIQKKEYDNATICHICEEKLYTEDKVRDHDHLTGLYRGAAHNRCNLNYKVPKFIPVFFHNFSGYDSHLLVRELGNDTDNIDLLPNNEDNYISFSKKIQYSTKNIELRFLDSYKFLSNSLSELAKSMKLYNFKILKKWFQKEIPGNLTELQKVYLFRLLTKKLAFPYDYMNSVDKYKETKLPPKESFYNLLNNKHISDDEYHYATEIWKYFNIKNLKEFNMLYNIIDVILLADIMEYFREKSLKTYGLDPAWYYTTPGFAWDCMLKTTGQKIELLTDIDMLLMFERAKRGGLSQCSNRYSKANNKYMGKKFNENKESTYIQYLDANNLYGDAMSKHLPYGGFKWVKPIYFNANIILKMKDNQKKGYLFEVDLIYPKELHTKHNDLPYCPENIIDNQKLPKLFTTLYDKNNYVIHYSNLQQALRAGLRLKKIHRVIEFSQSDWMKVYIDKNTELRQMATNDFDIAFYKTMNNSVFGRSMMDVRKHVNIKLISEETKYTKYVSKTNFKKSTFFSKNLAAVQMNKTEIIFNQPMYIGVCILEISKVVMYDFYYKLKERYGDKIRYNYGDTDSLIITVKTEDLYEDMKDMINEYDTSGYDKYNVYGIPQVNKKVIGKFKDELNGRIIEQFIGLASKSYTIKVFTSNIEIKKAKGVKNGIVKNIITHDDYKICLENNICKNINQAMIQSKKHEIHTVKQTKTGLNWFDDKRYLIKGETNTLAWGHFSIDKEKDNFINHLKAINKTRKI